MDHPQPKIKNSALRPIGPLSTFAEIVGTFLSGCIHIYRNGYFSTISVCALSMHVTVYTVQSRTLTQGWVQKACPQTKEEEKVVQVEGSCYVDCSSLLAGNIHQPDWTEQHVSVTQPSGIVAASCAMCEGMQP